MNTLKVAGKFLDQPMLVTKFHNAVPAILTTGAALYTTKEILHAPEEKSKKCAVRTVKTMALTVASHWLPLKLQTNFSRLMKFQKH